MSPTVQFVFYLLAVVCFAAEFVRSRPAWNLIALGLALAFTVPMWAAAKAI